MPPWPEWQVEYVGASFLGKLLGFWSAFWISLLKKLLRWSGTGVNNSRQVAYRHRTHGDLGNDARLSTFQVRKKLYRMAISTCLMLGFWRVATLRPLWLSVSESGHRVVLGFLFLLTASWMMSMVWICLSKPHTRG